MTFLLGADFGTGGAKVALINDQGEQLGYAFEEYPIHTDGPGWSEHDAPRYWEAFCRLTRQVLAESRRGTRRRSAASPSPRRCPRSSSSTRTATPLPRAYNLMDRRATAEVAWLKEHVGAERIFGVTANRLEDHPALVNLLWERNHRPERFRTHRHGPDHRRLHQLPAHRPGHRARLGGTLLRRLRHPRPALRPGPARGHGRRSGAPAPPLCAARTSSARSARKPPRTAASRPAPRWPAARWTATPAGCRAAPSSRATSR